MEESSQRSLTMSTHDNDPVYDAIERHRRAYAEVIAAVVVDNAPIAADAHERERAALEALAGTQPASVDGCSALLYYIANDMADRTGFDWSRICANVAAALVKSPGPNSEAPIADEADAVS